MTAGLSSGHKNRCRSELKVQIKNTPTASSFSFMIDAGHKLLGLNLLINYSELKLKYSSFPLGKRVRTVTHEGGGRAEERRRSGDRRSGQQRLLHHQTAERRGERVTGRAREGRPH